MGRGRVHAAELLGRHELQPGGPGPVAPGDGVRGAVHVHPRVAEAVQGPVGGPPAGRHGGGAVPAAAAAIAGH